MSKTQFSKPGYDLYKPLKAVDAGAALQFAFDLNKKAIFLDAAKQKGERLETGSKDQFDWENKIVFKLGVTDVGQLLLLLSGKVKNIKLIHSSQDRSHVSVLDLTKQEGNYDNFSLKLSRTDTDDKAAKTTKSVNIYIDHHEMVILAHFLRTALTIMLGFESAV